MRLDRVGRLDRRGDGSSGQDVVGEDEIGRKMPAERFAVQLDVALELSPAQLVQKSCLQALVFVEHEHRQSPADLRPDQLRRADVVALGVPLLAEEQHLVARPAPLAGQRARVDVGARSAEQVTVPEKDLHQCVVVVVVVVV